MEQRVRRCLALMHVAAAAVVVLAGATALVACGSDDHAPRTTGNSTQSADCRADAVPDYVRRIAFSEVDRSDPRPSTAQWARTTRSSAESVASGPASVVADDGDAYVVQIAGGAFVPPRGPGSAPPGSVLMLTISVAREGVTDAGISNQAADLSSLGTVGEFSLDPACAPVEPTGPAQCAQLAVTFEAVQGATQSFVGAFWVRNIGTEPCALHGGLVVDLLDETGRTIKTVSHPSDPETALVLEPHAEAPSNPPPSGIASFLLQWHELDVANGGTACPETPLSPAQLVVTFDGGAAQVTTSATPQGDDLPVRPIHACEGDVTLHALQPIT